MAVRPLAKFAHPLVGWPLADEGDGRRLKGEQNIPNQFVKRHAFGLRLGKVRLFNMRWKIERDGHKQPAPIG